MDDRNKKKKTQGKRRTYPFFFFFSRNGKVPFGSLWPTFCFFFVPSFSRASGCRSRSHGARRLGERGSDGRRKGREMGRQNGVSATSRLGEKISRGRRHERRSRYPLADTSRRCTVSALKERQGPLSLSYPFSVEMDKRLYHRYEKTRVDSFFVSPPATELYPPPSKSSKGHAGCGKRFETRGQT